MIDHENLYVTTGGFQFKSELLLNGGKNGRARRVGGRYWISTQIQGVLSKLRRPLQLNVKTATQLCLINNHTIESL